MATSPTPPFVEHCLELLGALGPTRARRMFGGWGIYVDGVFIAVIAQERLYLKATDQTQGQFAAAGGEAFAFHKDGEILTMRYWTVPAEAMESPSLMLPWARLAMQAALSAAAARQAAALKPGRAAAKKTGRARRR